MSKKDFDNAAMQFISGTSNLNESAVPEPDPETLEAWGLDKEAFEKTIGFLNTVMRKKVVDTEAKTAKLHIQVTPTLAAAIKKAAKARKTSQNAIINEALEKIFLLQEE